jgi:hypothetical protein
MSTLSSILKYFGLVIAACSSVWAAIHDVTTKDADGRKRLTKEGRWALSFTFIGLLTTLVTTYVDGVVQDRHASQALQRESSHLRQTITSSQPLQSITLTWKFDSIPPLTVRRAEDAAENVLKHMSVFNEVRRDSTDSEFRAAEAILDHDYMIVPFLNVLGGGPWVKDDVIALFALDDAASSVIPLGSLSTERYSTKEDKALSEKGYREIAGGISTDFGLQRRRLFQSPDSEPRLVRDTSAFTLSWTLHSSDWLSAVDATNKSSAVTAKLPDHMQVIILTGIRHLPVQIDNMATTVFPLPWGKNSDATGANVRVALRNSVLTLTPNGVEGAVSRYQMHMVCAFALDDPSLNDDPANPLVKYCDAALWRGDRILPGE